MESMFSFVGIIIIVFGILQIILFFKMWLMTDDVKRIKNNLIDGTDASFDTAKKEFMLGNTDKAFEIYNKCFINDVMAIYKETRDGAVNAERDKERYEGKYKEKCDLYQKEIEKLGSKYSIDYLRFDTLKKIDFIMD